MKKLLILGIAMCPLYVAAESAPGSHFVENWDGNSDGVVTLDELRAKRADVFYTFDSNDDGFLDAEEYSYFDSARKSDMENQPAHANGKMGRVQDGMVLTFNDTDGDGRVNKSEFLTKAAAWLAMIDRDRSGDVTAADFGPRG